jgi:hypothetical protein
MLMFVARSHRFYLKLPDDDFNEAVRIAQAEFDQHHPDVVAGSSRGTGQPACITAP